MKQTEAKHNHVSQVRALRSKSRDVPESLISGSIEEQTSLGSLDSHKPTKSKHRKQLEDYDAVSYRVDDNAKERKRKHKKLMEIISPRQHHGSCNTGTADDIEMNSNSHPTNVSLSTPQVKERNEGELGTDSAEKLQQQLFSPFSDDLEAFNDIPAESLEPRPPQHDKLQDVDVRHNNASVTKAEKVFVDPFVHVDSSIKMSIDNSVIPTYIDKDWVTMLHSDGDDDPEDILLAL
ncbi:hypothetical protein EON65_08190 [archaeon]|nr:MAG: hypothetical protein EON65_08190 [archaeon]